MSETLYERIGGRDAVNAAVDIFYDKIMADDRINHYFENLDMVKQRGKQKVFLTYAFGGAPNYSGKSMREAHKHLNLTEDDFNAVGENLVATLNQLNVPQGLIDEIMDIVASTKDDVLNR
ncbi:MAG: group 1 truncated hemoglobin [Alphaproteobacteria bacterium]|nr:group 1 truncated hemoglobin [Alphaproteobacteria bacterium]